MHQRHLNKIAVMDIVDSGSLPIHIHVQGEFVYWGIIKEEPSSAQS